MLTVLPKEKWNPENPDLAGTPSARVREGGGTRISPDARRTHARRTVDADAGVRGRASDVPLLDRTLSKAGAGAGGEQWRGQLVPAAAQRTGGDHPPDAAARVRCRE